MINVGMIYIHTNDETGLPMMREIYCPLLGLCRKTEDFLIIKINRVGNSGESRDRLKKRKENEENCRGSENINQYQVQGWFSVNPFFLSLVLYVLYRIEPFRLHIDAFVL